MRFIRKPAVIGRVEFELSPDWSPVLKQPDTRQVHCPISLKI